jgi:hypothetical protein
MQFVDDTSAHGDHQNDTAGQALSPDPQRRLGTVAVAVLSVAGIAAVSEEARIGAAGSADTRDGVPALLKSVEATIRAAFAVVVSTPGPIGAGRDGGQGQCGQRGQGGEGESDLAHVDFLLVL